MISMSRNSDHLQNNTYLLFGISFKPVVYGIYLHCNMTPPSEQKRSQ